MDICVSLKLLAAYLNQPDLKKLTVPEICRYINKTPNQFYCLFGKKITFYSVLIQVMLEHSLYKEVQEDLVAETIVPLLLKFKKYKYFFLNILKLTANEEHDILKGTIESEFERYLTWYITKKLGRSFPAGQIRIAALKICFILSMWLKSGCEEKTEIIWSLFGDIFHFLDEI